MATGDVVLSRRDPSRPAGRQLLEQVERQEARRARRDRRTTLLGRLAFAAGFSVVVLVSFVEGVRALLLLRKWKD